MLQNNSPLVTLGFYLSIVFQLFFLENFETFEDSISKVKLGHNHLLEIRLLETGFLILFQPNPLIRWVVFDVCQKKKILGK
jgi:hypothetical protein